MKTKGKEKYYLVVSKKRGYTYGAFPYTEQGLIDAKKYIKQSEKKQKEELVIKEKA